VKEDDKEETLDQTEKKEEAPIDNEKLEEEFKEGNIISCIYTGVENDTLLARIA